ncbi:MAG TPA: RNA polymerase sigma factor [Anaeromyxobacter sp.]|nr:RNA polymerase sigma factor [Anaeromyxobacter sp.]
MTPTPKSSPPPGRDDLPGRLSDTEIVARVRAGDVPLFEILMRRHNARLYRVVRSVLRDEDEAEDAMQQAYLRAYRSLGQFEGLSSFSTWLLRIGLNEALGRVRGRGRMVALDDLGEAEAMSERSPNPEESASSRQAVFLVERAIDRLPAIHRTILVLREVEGLSTSEAARTLGVTEEVAKVRLHRARLALRDALAEELGRDLREAFPFEAPRCDRVVNRVMAELRDH